MNRWLREAAAVQARTRLTYPWTRATYAMPALPSNEAAYKTVTVSNPAPATDWSALIPAGKWWFLYAVYAVLAQGATQTPQPLLQLDDGTSLWMESTGSTAVQAASTTCAYSWAPNMLLTGQIGSGANVHSNAPIPDSLVLPGGYHVKTNTIGIGANSQWQNVRIMVAELG